MPRIGPLKTKLSDALKGVALDVARAVTGTRKLAKSGRSYEDAVQALADDFHVRVVLADGCTKTDDAIEVLLAIDESLRALATCGDAVEKAISSPALLDIVLDPGEHIREEDPNNPLVCYPSSAFADYEKDSASVRIATGLGMDDAHDHPQVGVGEHNVGKGFRSVFTHEMGHMCMQDVEDAARISFAQVYDSQPKEYWERTVSKYSGTSSHELFAECFAAYTHQGYEDNLPPEVVDFFQRASLRSNVRKLSKGRNSDPGAEFDDLYDDVDWSAAEEAMIDDLREAFIEAAKQESDVAGYVIDTDMVNDEAVAYAQERAAEAITDIADTTREAIRDSVVEALEEGTSYQDFMAELVDSYQFSESRAEMIARTELATANVQGHVVIATEAGATGKVWLLSNDHDDSENCNCSDNADEGEIPFDEDWSSGDDWPPAHPNCMCDWAATYGKSDDAEDEED